MLHEADLNYEVASKQKGFDESELSDEERRPNDKKQRQQVLREAD